MSDKKIITKIGDFELSDPLLEATNRGLIKLIDYIVDQVYDNEIYLLKCELDEKDNLLELYIDENYPVPNEIIQQATATLKNFVEMDYTDKINEIKDSGKFGSNFASAVAGWGINISQEVVKFAFSCKNVISNAPKTITAAKTTIDNVCKKEYASALMGLCDTGNALADEWPTIVSNTTNQYDVLATREDEMSKDEKIKDYRATLEDIDKRIRELQKGIQDLLSLQISIDPATIESEAGKNTFKTIFNIDKAKSNLNLNKTIATVMDVAKNLEAKMSELYNTTRTWLKKNVVQNTQTPDSGSTSSSTITFMPKAEEGIYYTKTEDSRSYGSGSLITFKKIFKE